MIDRLIEASDQNSLDVALYNQHVAAIPLLALVPARNLKVGLAVATTGFDDGKLAKRERFRKAGLQDVTATATGAEVGPISLGAFDLEAALLKK